MHACVHCVCVCTVLLHAAAAMHVLGILFRVVVFAVTHTVYTATTLRIHTTHIAHLSV